jgi:orotate phosphoribosyltransferase
MGMDKVYLKQHPLNENEPELPEWAKGFTLQDRIDLVWRQVRLYLKNDAYIEGDVTLSSGKKSNYYLEMSNVINNCLCLPRLVELLHREILEIIRDHRPSDNKGEWWKDKFAGIAGIALGGAQIVSAYTARHPYLPSLTVRLYREKAPWGKIELSPHTKPGKVILVDDVLTTGNSLLTAKHHLERVGFEVYKAFVFVDRQDGGLEKCEQEDLDVISFFTSKDIREA